MKSWTAVEPAVWAAFVERLRPRLETAPSLADACQTLSEALAEIEPTALARVYAILPYRELPADVRGFVDELAGAPPPSTTRVLTLMGTAGRRPEWCDRRQSLGHQGIPLISASFVEAIPMLSRLLKELGFDLAWLDTAQDVFARKLIGGFNGIFYVADAKTARDANGRLVIPAVDFVAAENVETVFGMGGTNPDGTVLAWIVFTSAKVPRATVERLTSLLTMLKGETFRAVLERRFFPA